MSAATSSRSCAISRDRHCPIARATAARRQAQAEARAEERIVDALTGKHRVASTRESFPQAAARQANSTTRKSNSKCARRAAAAACSKSPACRAPQIGMVNHRRHAGQSVRRKAEKRRMTVAAAHDPLVAEEADKLLDNDAIIREAIDTVETERHRVSRRDRQDLRPQRISRRRRCQPRRRATRSPAADRRHDGRDQAWQRENGSYPLHRVGRVPHGEAGRSVAGTAGPVADPRRTEGARAATISSASSPRPKRASSSNMWR